MPRLRLEDPCHICHGTGCAVAYEEGERFTYPCFTCHGSGFLPTQLGEKILQLLAHNQHRLDDLLTPSIYQAVRHYEQVEHTGHNHARNGRIYLP